MRTVGVFVVFMLLASLSWAQDAASVVEKVNANNAKVKSFVADVENVVQKQRITMTAQGKLYYEKERNFRITASQATTGQLSSDIGSNDEYFWFWVKKLDPRTMYFSSYKDLYKTGLKDSLHPLWMIEGFGLAAVDAKGAKVYNSGGYVVVVKPAVNPRGEHVYRMAYIDPSKPAVIGHRTYDAHQQVNSSIEIQDWYSTNAGVYLPKRVLVTWHGEGIRVTQTLSNPRVNVAIPAETWKMPSLNARPVNMGRQNINWEQYREEN